MSVPQALSTEILQTLTLTPTPPPISVPRNIVVQVPPAPSTKIWLLPILGTFLLFIGAMMWIGFTITAGKNDAIM